MFMGRFDRKEAQVYDATAVTCFMECPRKYFYRHVLGIVPSIIKPYFAWGSSYHVYREELDKLYLEDPTQPLMEIGIKALQKANQYFTKHMPPIEPKSTYSFMTKDRFIASCQLAFDKWTKEKTSGKIQVLSVEQAFVIELDDGTKLAGKADQVVRWSGQVWGRDWKTTKSTGKYYENGLNPNYQFSLYTYAESRFRGYDFNEPTKNARERVQGQIVDVLQNSKTTGPKIETYTTDRTPNEILNWLKEHKYWVNKISECRDKDFWPMNPKSCAFCPYRSICIKPSESSQMSEIKNRFKVDHWNPMAVKEE